MLKAAEILLKEEPDARFVFLGGGLELGRLKGIAKARVQKCELPPTVPMDSVGKYLSAADALLVHLKRNPLFRITIPSKTQAYMVVEIIIMGVDGDAADLILEAKCGFLADPEEPRSIADAVKS